MWLQWCIHTCEWNTTISGVGADGIVKQLDKRNKGAISKNCAPFRYEK